MTYLGVMYLGLHEKKEACNERQKENTNLARNRNMISIVPTAMHHHNHADFVSSPQFEHLSEIQKSRICIKSIIC